MNPQDRKIIREQQKAIEELQRNVSRLQVRLDRLENKGFVSPSEAAEFLPIGAELIRNQIRESEAARVMRRTPSWERGVDYIPKNPNAKKINHWLIYLPNWRAKYGQKAS